MLRICAALLVLFAGCGGAPPSASRPTATTKAASSEATRTAAPAEAGGAATAPKAAVADAPVVPAPPLSWTLVARPERLKLSDADSLELEITVTNDGTTPGSPLAQPLDFTVDGARATALTLAFNNGAKAAAWRSLPPGGKVSDRRVGVAVADTAGDHVIVLLHEEDELARTTVHFEP